MSPGALMAASVAGTLTVCGCALADVSDLTLGLVALVASVAVVRSLHAEVHRDIPDSVHFARRLGRESPEYVSPSAPTPRCGPIWPQDDASQLTRGGRRDRRS